MSRVEKTNGEAVATAALLTPSQIAILQWASWGKNNEQIGAILGYTDKTVMAYMTKIMDTIGTSSRTGAVAWALRQGVIK